MPDPARPPTSSTEPQNGQLNPPQRAILLTQVDIPEGAAPDLPAQPVPVPNPQLHGDSSARPRSGSAALSGLLALVLMSHSPAVPDAIAALVSPLDTSETGKTVAAAPEQDGHGSPTRPVPQPLRPRATILRDLTSLATGADRAAAGTGARRAGRGCGPTSPAPPVSQRSARAESGAGSCPIAWGRPSRLPGPWRGGEGGGGGQGQSLRRDPANIWGKPCHSCRGGVLGSPLPLRVRMIFSKRRPKQIAAEHGRACMRNQKHSVAM